MNTKTRSKSQAPADCRVIVTVSGGVADVLFKPKGVEICIIDYDVDDEDADHLERDPDGQACCIQRHPADEKVVSHEDWPIVRSAARRINGHAKRRWQCPECRRIVHSTDESLAEAGTPFCSDCDVDMQMI